MKKIVLILISIFLIIAVYSSIFLPKGGFERSVDSIGQYFSPVAFCIEFANSFVETFVISEDAITSAIEEKEYSEKGFVERLSEAIDNAYDSVRSFNFCSVNPIYHSDVHAHSCIWIPIEFADSGIEFEKNFVGGVNSRGFVLYCIGNENQFGNHVDGCGCIGIYTYGNFFRWNRVWEFESCPSVITQLQFTFSLKFGFEKDLMLFYSDFVKSGEFYLRNSLKEYIFD